MTADNGRCFVDASILVYAFDRLEGQKHLQALQLIESLWKTRTGVISTQVLQEFHTTFTRSGGLGATLDASQEILNAFSFWDVFIPRANDLLRAIELQKIHQLPFYDSLIIQSALAGKCSVIYSESLSQNLRVDGVSILNPFLEVQKGMTHA